MTTIRDRRGWLSKLRGTRNRGSATTEEQMVQLGAELEELLAGDIVADEEQRFRVAEGACVSEEGQAALARGRTSPILKHVARLIGGGDG